MSAFKFWYIIGILFCSSSITITQPTNNACADGSCSTRLIHIDATARFCDTTPYRSFAGNWSKCRPGFCKRICGDGHICWLDKFKAVNCRSSQDPELFIIFGAIGVSIFILALSCYRNYKLRNSPNDDHLLNAAADCWNPNVSRLSFPNMRSNSISVISSPSLDCHYDFPPTYAEAMDTPNPV